MRHWVYITIVWASGWAVSAQDRTSCRGTTLDWYSSVAGESPCLTYQRLRRICNPSYTVGTLSTATPGDNCDEQVADCCCNSIAFALSMLCLNCQQGVGSGIHGDTGIDAGKGAYQMYLTGEGRKTCQPNVNQSLPTGIQTAVCNNKIKIYDDLYNLFWATGDWFYEFTRQSICKDQAIMANNTFTHCASTTLDIYSQSLSSSATSFGQSVSTAKSSSSSSASVGGIAPAKSTAPLKESSISLSKGALAGIVAGAASLFILVGVVLCFLRKRGKQTSTLKYGSVRPAMDSVFRIEPFNPPTEVHIPHRGKQRLKPDYGAVRLEMNTVYRIEPCSPTSECHHSPTQITIPCSRSVHSVHKACPHAEFSRSRTDSVLSVPQQYHHKACGHAESSRSRTDSLLSATRSRTGRTGSRSTLPRLITERHVDAGAVQMLERSPSGRLPPAYGDQLEMT